MRAYIVFFLILFDSLPSLAASSESTRIIVIKKPTVIAYFNITQKEVDKNEDVSEALSDFQIYTERATARLKTMNITLHQRYGPSFRIRVGGKVKLVPVSKGDHGYYFVTPTKPAKIFESVGTDEDIVRSAAKYFKLIEPKQSPAIQ